MTIDHVMRAADIRTVAVLGTGLMGSGIALDFATRGYAVRLYGRQQARLDQALETIEHNSHLLARTDRTHEAGPHVRDRVRTGTLLPEVVRDADLVVEAVAENLALKQNIFAELDSCCHARTILTSTTSTFLPSALASATQRPDRVLVAHYFNPPYLMPLVELVQGTASNQTTETLREFFTNIGKHPAVVRQEIPGFIGNRLQAALLREAYALVDRGIATPEDIDAVVRYGFGRRLAVAGVFEIGDLAGLELYRAAFEVLFADIDASPDLPRCLEDRLTRRDFGAKTGAGFYEWPAGAADRARQRIARALIAIDGWDAVPADAAVMGPTP